MPSVASGKTQENDRLFPERVEAPNGTSTASPWEQVDVREVTGSSASPAATVPVLAPPSVSVQIPSLPCLRGQLPTMNSFSVTN